MTIRVCEAMNAPVGRLSDRTVCEANGGVLPRQVLIDTDGRPVLIRTILPQKRHQPEPVPFIGGDGGIRTHVPG